MKDVVSIRMAREEDAAAIRVLTREAYAKWVGLIGREPLPMRVALSRPAAGAATSGHDQTAAGGGAAQPVKALERRAG